MVKHYEQHATPAAWIAAVAITRGENDAAQLDRALQLYSDPVNEKLAVKGSAIADMMLTLEMDTESITAALLYPAVKNHLVHIDTINEHYGLTIGKLLNDCLQMQALNQLRQNKQYESHQIENLRKMLLAMVTDTRAVLIILAERLWKLRTAKALSQESQRKLAQETLDIYAPLANRLGIWQLKWEMEDLCLRYLNSEIYSGIAKWLSTRRTEREEYIAKVINLFETMFKDAGTTEVKIMGRVKHIYSIHHKMQRKHVPVEEIYDISAVRVLVPNIEDCYYVLGLLQEKFQRIEQEFDDYIAQPKPNGYQSIHTVLYGPENRIIEVQIRTFEMHETSELGAASHWRYKEGMSQEAAYEMKIALLRQIMAWQKEVTTNSETRSGLPEQDIFADRVYVFTPQGDIIDLPQGATPLDFAYHIHSEVGHRCRGAKVDGKMVPLTHTLQTGNRVEILTAKQPNPSRDWLNVHLAYLKSGRARSILAHWFRVKDSAMEKELKKSRPVVTTVSVNKKLPDHFELQKKTLKPAGSITGVDSLLTKLALCCKPLPGDAVVGYITQNRGVSIHRRDCSNITHMTRKDSNRFIDVNWGNTPVGKYPVELVVRAVDRANLLRDMTGALGDGDFNLAGVRTQLISGNEVLIYLTIMIAGVDDLNKATRLLQHIDQVLEVRRM